VLHAAGCGTQKAEDNTLRRLRAHGRSVLQCDSATVRQCAGEEVGQAPLERLALECFSRAAEQSHDGARLNLALSHLSVATAPLLRPLL
jgi:hypothetical protein